MIEKKVKLIYCWWGAGISLGISGTKEEVQRVCNGLYNLNATDSEPIWLNDNEKTAFAYILTDWERLKKGLSDMFIVGLLTNRKTKHKRLKGGFMPLARVKADNRLASIIFEQFLGARSNECEIFSITNQNPPELTDSTQIV